MKLGLTGGIGCGKSTAAQFFEQEGRDKGKPAKVALVAVMRKLIVLANQILKNPNIQLGK